MSLYSLYKEVFPPGCIELCTEARFISPNQINLIVARGTSLEIYNLIEEEAPELHKQLIREDAEDHVRLLILLSFDLGIRTFHPFYETEFLYTRNSAFRLLFVNVQILTIFKHE